MYQVIARKYRPQTFADVVNQEHVKTTLENAIAQKRIAHGYIFSGQRGTGKTTIARIMARCLNCVDGPTALPCGVCASCKEIQGGGCVDVIEIDAASNRGIDNMRELRENVRYQPQRDRYKVFIIDEAHQITSEAFNALLKTIEEPPEWVVFMLCTTESHKIPATIASRCQHFSFRSVDFDDLVARMQWICEQEGIQADTEALAIIAQSGEGSVRDSLSALDQAIACCGNQLHGPAVRELLGAFSLDALGSVTESLAASDSAKMLGIVDELERNGRTLQHFSRELSRYFRNLLVARIAGPETRLIAASPAERQRMADTAAEFSEEDLTRYLQLSLDLFRELQFSLQPRFHLEIGLVKLVHAGRLKGIEELLSGGVPAARPARSNAPAPAAARPEAVRKPAGAMAVPPAAPPPPPPEAGGSDWRSRLHRALGELGMTFTADAVEHCDVREGNGELVFTTPPGSMLSMATGDLAQALKQIGSRPMKLKFVTGDVAAAAAPLESKLESKKQEDEVAERALANPEVQRFKELFGGEVRGVRNLKE